MSDSSVKWVEEKVEFISAIVPGVDEVILREQLKVLKDEDEVADLMSSLLEHLDNSNYEEGNLRSVEGHAESPRGAAGTTEDNEHLAKVSEASERELSGAERLVMSPEERSSPVTDPMTFDRVFLTQADWTEDNAAAAGDESRAAGGSQVEDDHQMALSLAGEYTLAEALEHKLAARHAELISLFPDAQPDYLRERCEELADEGTDFTKLVEELMEMKKNPRMRGNFDMEKEATKKTYKEHVIMEQQIQETLFDLQEDSAQYELFLCVVCREEEILGLNTVTCSSPQRPHRYCVPCVTRYIASCIGEGHTSFKCIDEDCAALYPDKVLLKVMTPTEFTKTQERRQQEVIRVSKLRNLETCPFCTYAVIMDDPNDKVLVCRNPLCLKESCRLCKEETHVPLRCNEVEKDHQTQARLKIEEEMSRAMIRKCPECGQNIVGEAGCNKMTCPCGTVMCYICRQKIRGYDHFERSSIPSDKCPLWRDLTKLHDSEVRQAAATAREALGPDLTLVHDPTTGVL
nr:E3 ubiquitin-protein ligase RNF216-like [Procambarus clarkii]